MDMAKMDWDFTRWLKVDDMCLVRQSPYRSALATRLTVSLVQFYYKDMDEPESQLSDDEKAQLCKRVALARRKKTKASDEVWATLLLFVLLIPMPSPGHIIVAYSAPTRARRTWSTLQNRESTSAAPALLPRPARAPVRQPMQFSQKKRRLTFGRCLV